MPLPSAVSTSVNGCGEGKMHEITNDHSSEENMNSVN